MTHWVLLDAGTEPTPNNEVTHGVREIQPVDFVRQYEIYELPTEESASKLSEYKDALLAEINANRDALFYTDKPYGATFVQFRNERDRANLSNILQGANESQEYYEFQLANNVPDIEPPTVELILADDTIEEFTVAEYKAMVLPLFKEKSDIRTNARRVKNAIVAATTKAALDSIDLGIFG